MVQTPIDPQVLYPDSDGQPMADNTVQYRWIVRLVANLKHLFKGQTVFVAGDLLWYPQQVTVPPAPAQTEIAPLLNCKNWALIQPNSNHPLPSALIVPLCRLGRKGRRQTAEGNSPFHNWECIDFKEIALIPCLLPSALRLDSLPPALCPLPPAL